MIAIIAVAARGDTHLWAVILSYVVAKMAEYFDLQIYSVFLLSGHTFKHLLAGLATWFIFRWIHGHQSGPDAAWPDIRRCQRATGPSRS